MRAATEDDLTRHVPRTVARAIREHFDADEALGPPASGRGRPRGAKSP